MPVIVFNCLTVYLFTYSDFFLLSFFSHLSHFEKLDYPRLVDHYMRQCMYSDALKILATYPNCLNRLYDHASCLASKCPEEFVNVCLRLNNKLDINRLVIKTFLFFLKKMYVLT